MISVFVSKVTVDDSDPLKTLASFEKASVIRKLLQLRKDFDKSESAPSVGL
ncbi:hypothetical protein DPMN_092834 [Dreissena polymorpha]|uniref:Uncharacterized protein n=1 Tax=Dreissena polymorpha TaxID=45954 RepID=A0A9D4R196_DREPO|nr:hypothetical protein DPMN_092834 [Dreissena polymorpha]